MQEQSPVVVSGPATRLPALLAEGQSVWLDALTRDLIRGSGLRDLIARGVRGLTSNPTIFAAALKGSAYDDDIRGLVAKGLGPDAVFEALAVKDIQDACDRFRPLYDKTEGADGFVSIEVSPGCARDTKRTIVEGNRLWRRVARPNAMVKVPGTKEGWPAIEALLREGVNVNITLLFARAHHAKVIDAYLNALEARVAGRLPINRLASVASFFVSRVDTMVDALLDDGRAALRGKAGLANARLAYAQFRARFDDKRFAPLRKLGAREQRPLWASTATKNPAYRDVMYVEGLIGPDTINTLPQKTLAAFDDHGAVHRTLDAGLDDARRALDALATAGVDLADVTRRLEDEGIASFAKSYAEVLDVVRAHASR